jgi:predicted SAM-dependent methyltransferase
MQLIRSAARPFDRRFLSHRRARHIRHQQRTWQREIAAQRLLEYFDPDGEFHCQAWQTADGMISRSSEHDDRNQTKPLSYTSLIVDCWSALRQQP